MDEERHTTKEQRIRIGMALTLVVIIFGSFIITDNLKSVSMATLIYIGFVIAYLWTGGKL